MDYVLEAGATRNFEALRTAELMAQKEADQKEAELANNPMKVHWALSSSVETHCARCRLMVVEHPSSAPFSR